MPLEAEELAALSGKWVPLDQQDTLDQRGLKVSRASGDYIVGAMRRGDSIDETPGYAT